MNKTVVVRRLRTYATNKIRFYATATSDCEIQNIDPVANKALDGLDAKVYKAWFDSDENIREGDQLTDQDTGVRYKVIGVEKMGQGLGLQAEHLEVLMTRYSES